MLFRSLVQMPVYHCACLLLRLICLVVLSVHEAGRRLVQLEGKVQALEQKRTFETTESIFDGCSLYLNRLNCAFDRLDLPVVVWDSVATFSLACIFSAVKLNNLLQIFSVLSP